MGTSLAPDQLRAARWHALLLDGSPAGPHGGPDGGSGPGPSAGNDAGAVVASIAAHLGGLQAQAAPPARLAVRPRALRRTSTTLAATDVDRACADGAVTRTRAMRGTLHLVATPDVRWMTELFGPIFIQKDHRRRLQLGLDDERCERALTALASILAGSPPLTRAELIERLAADGVAIDPRTQQPPHLLGYAAGRGLICRGPDRAGDEPTYVRLDEWAPDAPALSRDDARAELVRRYLGGYGPATRADFAAWSGLPAADTRRAWDLIAAETVAVSTAAAEPASPKPASPKPASPRPASAELTRTRPADNQLAALSGAPLHGPPPPPRLLGHFDPLLMGYSDRELILDPANAKRVQAGGGFVQPTVLVGGRVAGTWRLDRRASRSATARVVVEPFAELTAATREALAAEATDVGRYLGTDVTFQVAHS